MYLVFYGNSYYPLGGWLDLKGTSFRNINEAKDYLLTKSYDWFQIVNLKTLEIEHEHNRNRT